MVPNIPFMFESDDGYCCGLGPILGGNGGSLGDEVTTENFKHLVKIYNKR